MDAQPPERRSLYLPALVLLGLSYAVGLGGLDLFLVADEAIAGMQLGSFADGALTALALLGVLLLPLGLGFAAAGRVGSAPLGLTTGLLLVQPFGCASLARSPEIAPFPLWQSLLVNLIVVACLLLPRWILARRARSDGRSVRP